MNSIKETLGVNMVQLKEITEKSWIVLNGDTNDNLGLLSQQNNNELIFVVKGGKTVFKDREEVCEFFGDQKVFVDAETPLNIVVGKENFVNGFPVDFPNPYAVEIDTELPVYSKTQDGSVAHCAGYYVIHFPKGPIQSFCPKYSTIDKYTVDGPFKTELEMKSVLSQLKKKIRDGYIR